jgi:hypothetical protein
LQGGAWDRPPQPLTQTKDDKDPEDGEWNGERIQVYVSPCGVRYELNSKPGGYGGTRRSDPLHPREYSPFRHLEREDQKAGKKTEQLKPPAHSDKEDERKEE